MAAGQVAALIEETASAGEGFIEIAGVVKGTSTRLGTIAAASEQVAAASDETGRSSEEVARLAETLKGVADGLEEYVA